MILPIQSTTKSSTSVNRTPIVSTTFAKSRHFHLPIAAMGPEKRAPAATPAIESVYTIMT